MKDDKTKEEVLAQYEDYPATNTGDLDANPFYESRVLPILFEIKKNSKVLDIGCNDGSFAKLLSDKRSCDVTGIDVSQKLVTAGREKGLNLLVADAEKLPFQDKTFDYVVCMEVLPHLFDPSKALKEIRRVLKKDGILLGSCPHENIDRYLHEDARFHRNKYNQDTLHVLLTESFGRAWIRSLTGAQFSIAMAGSYLTQEPVEMLFKCGRANTLSWDEALQDRSILRCWFGFTQPPGDVYYRMSGYADKMQKMGAETHYNPFDETDQNSCLEWTLRLRWNQEKKKFTNQHIADQLHSLLKASDMSVFQITSSRSVLALLTAFRDPKNLFPQLPKKPLLCEMDDWFFDIPPSHPASAPYHPNSEPESVAYDQIKLSDGIICSTEYLQKKIENLFPDKKTYLIKNSLDFDIWDKVERKTKAHEEKKDLVRIVYTGSGYHHGDVEIIKRPLLVLLDEFPNVEFLSLPFECFKGVRHKQLFTWTHWAPLSRFPQFVADFEPDIGVAPLMDNEFNRVKSNLRWLEYSALRLPTIASNVEPFKKSIQDHKTGLLVGNSEKEWYEAIRSLIIDRGKRAEMGENSYQVVKRDFNMDNWAATYKSVLQVIKDEFIRSRSGNRPTPR